MKIECDVYITQIFAWKRKLNILKYAFYYKPENNIKKLWLRKRCFICVNDAAL